MSATFAMFRLFAVSAFAAAVRFLRDRRGVSTVEYALIVVAVIAVVGLVAGTMADAFQDLFNDLSNEMSTGISDVQNNVAA